MKRSRQATRKRLVTLAAGAMLALPLQALAVPTGKLVSDDNPVGIPDVIKALRVAVGLDAPTANLLANGDVAPLNQGYPNPDGEIRIEDVIIILKKVAGVFDWPVGDQALRVASKVSVVDPRAEEVQLQAMRIAPMAVETADELPADSDYTVDRTSTYVHERSTEAFGVVNEILCMMAQSRYDAMLNRGPYKALIDQNLCRGNDSTANAGQSQQAGTSATNAPDYINWTIMATRDSNTAPQIIKVWIHEPAEDHGGGMDPEKLIQARVAITESSSDTNPYGIFSMDFIGYPVIEGQAAPTPMFRGILRAERDEATGKVLLKFADAEANQMFREAATLEKNPDGTGGGTAYQYESFDQQTREGTINFAYDANLFHRTNQDGSGETCLDRSSFETSAWSYGLYDSTTGNRVNVNSGFPIKYTADGVTSYGWIGYWGLWLPNNVTVPSGATVYKQAFGPGATENAYTVLKVQGKLKKHVRNTTTLEDIRNVPLEGYWEQVPGSNPPEGTSYRVIWDGYELLKVASSPQNTMGPPVWTELDPAVPIDVSNLPWGELNFWSQALGGQVRISLDNCLYNPGENGAPGSTSCDPPADTTAVAYYVESTILPGDPAPANLACFDNCPQAGASGMNPAGSLTYPTSFDPNVSNRHDYAFGNDMTLRDKGPQGNRNYPVILATSPQNQQWGFNSGALFDPSPANLQLLACDWDPQQTCGWKAWSTLDEFFTWETGPNNWNQLAVLTSPASGTALRFEQPRRVAYVHIQPDAGRPDAKYDGASFLLEYNGFGQLHGIPGKCVDANSGETVLDCSGPEVRWVPEFTIPAGAAVAENGPEGEITYFVKPLEMEQRMLKLDNAACTELPTSSYALPVIGENGPVEWTDPALGPEPQVAGAPAVIAGTLQ